MWRAANCRASAGSSSTAASAENSLPTTAARVITARTPGPRRSRRAVSNAAIVGGIGSSASLAAPSLSIAISCSMNRGFPSAVSSTRERRRSGEAAGEVGDQRLTVSVGKALEHERARVRGLAVPAGPPVEELGTGDADDEDRRAPHALGEVLDEIQKGGLGPVHILEEDDERPLPRQCFEQASGRPEDLLTIAGGPHVANRLPEAVGERPCLVVIGEQRSIRAGGREFADDLAQRPEGDALAVGHAPADEDGGLFGGERGELLREPRFPDPRRAEDRDHVQRALASRPLERPPEAGRPRRSRPTIGAVGEPTDGRSRARSRSLQAGPASVSIGSTVRAPRTRRSSPRRSGSPRPPRPPRARRPP